MIQSFQLTYKIMNSTTIKLLLVLSALFPSYLFGQVYTDYVGGGHSQGVTVTSSSGNTNDGLQSTDGSGLGIDEYQASRFLNHATLGADYETIIQVRDMGVSNWVDQQIAMPPQVSFTDSTWMLWNHFHPQYVAIWGYYNVVNSPSPVIPYWFYWKMAWWNNILKSDDLLRQRVAQAYSQVFVISDKSDLRLAGLGLASYYDVLYDNAFGNYKDLLYDITLHPAMGFYLSHINNPKTDHVNNIHPDENYAREVMQLFSIGLYELNLDGTKKLDSLGRPIPTYDNDDIGEFAKIFTGLAPSGYYWPWQDLSMVPVLWGEPLSNHPATIRVWEPMEPIENYHEYGTKYLLNGQVVPPGQPTLNDIEDAIDNLYNHPNVGPFIGRLLIQRLVKSNPTPAYIERVATVFNDNGSGVRGDMGAVVRTILTDSEALNCFWLDEPSHGKLKEPLLRYTQMLRAFNVYNTSGRLWNYGIDFERLVSQGILTSPSVFNFYSPDFQPSGPIGNAGLVGPEYEIHTAATSINYVNLVYLWQIAQEYGEVASNASNTIINLPGFNPNELNPDDFLFLDTADEEALAINSGALVDRIDLILTGGLLSTATKNNIRNAIQQLQFMDDRVQVALYMSLISPEYNIEK